MSTQPNQDNYNPLLLSNQEEKDQLSDEMISLRFLAQVNHIMIRDNISKKDLANKLKTSASYVTQLFQGDKLINVRLLTKLKRVLDINIDIVCHAKLNVINSNYIHTLEVKGLPQPLKSNLVIPFSNKTENDELIQTDESSVSISQLDNTYLLVMVEDKETGYYCLDSNLLKNV